MIWGSGLPPFPPVDLALALAEAWLLGIDRFIESMSCPFLYVSRFIPAMKPPDPNGLK
jgi:hypothetical protein